MTTNDTRSRIRSIIAEQAMLEPDQITDDATPGDLGIDSLGLVEISVPFNANEPEKSEFDISNMGTIIAAVDRLISEKAA